MVYALIALIITIIPAPAVANDGNSLVTSHHCYASSTVVSSKNIEYIPDSKLDTVGCHLNANWNSGLLHTAFHSSSVPTDGETTQFYEAYYDIGNGLDGWRFGRVPLQYGLHADNRIIRSLQDFIIHPPSIYRGGIWPTSQAVDGISWYTTQQPASYRYQRVYNVAIGRPIGLSDPELSFELLRDLNYTFTHGTGYSAGVKMSGLDDEYRVDIQGFSAKYLNGEQKKTFSRILLGTRQYIGDTVDVSVETTFTQVPDIKYKGLAWNVSVRWQATPQLRINGYYDTSCTGYTICNGTPPRATKILSLYSEYQLSRSLKLQAQTMRGNGNVGLNSLAAQTSQQWWSINMLGLVVEF
jgi:hypothetical protein